VLTQIARRRVLLESTDDWDVRGYVGHCFGTAVLEEDVDGTILDQLLAPYWSVLWRLAARGHWIRHAHRPAVHWAGRGPSIGTADPARAPVGWQV
jgi:hypothetical protein